MVGVTSPVVLTFGAMVATLGGGAMAMRLRERLHCLLGFAAGVLLGVVAFDLLPEIFALARDHQFDPVRAMIALIVGFLLFHGLEKLVLVRTVQKVHCSNQRRYRYVGFASAAALAARSSMDGVAIGIAFQVSAAVGLTVTIAMIAYEFSNGLDILGLKLRHRNSAPRAMVMLLGDALAPVLGALSTLAFTIAPLQRMICLGLFAGFLLYIGVSDLLPKAHSRVGRGVAVKLAGLTCCGAAFVFATVRLFPG